MHPPRRRPKATATQPRKPAHKRAPKTTLDYLQDALDDLGKARAHAQQDARSGIDSAVERIRDAVAQLRDRAGEPAREFETRLEQMSEDARRELGRMAVEAQQSPEALAELGTAIRRRKDTLGAS